MVAEPWANQLDKNAPDGPASWLCVGCGRWRREWLIFFHPAETPSPTPPYRHAENVPDRNHPLCQGCHSAWLGGEVSFPGWEPLPGSEGVEPYDVDFAALMSEDAAVALVMR